MKTCCAGGNLCRDRTRRIVVSSGGRVPDVAHLDRISPRGCGRIRNRSIVVDPDSASVMARLINVMPGIIDPMSHRIVVMVISVNRT
jgi:hypothetical protein